MFNNLFDFNDDGQLDASEQAFEFMVYREVTGENNDSKEDGEN